MSRLYEGLEALKAAVGTGGRHPDPEVQKATAARLCPNDTETWARHYLASPGAKTPTSTCALEGCAYLRARGCEHASLDVPYRTRIGQAVADFVAVARSYGAWTTDPADLATFPDFGDGYLIGPPEHVLVVVDHEPNNGVMVTIEGGQVDNTWTMRRRRMLLATAVGAYLVDPEKPRKDDGTPNGRRILGRVLGNRLP